MKRLLTFFSVIVALSATAIFYFYPFDKKEKENNKKEAADKPENYGKYFQMIRTAADEQAPSYPINNRMNEFNKALQNLATARVETDGVTFVERGPFNAAGRTRALVVDPADASLNTWFAGSVSGGIWKTSNGGRNWTNLTPNFPILAISTLAMSAANPNVIYAGTGESFGNGVVGNGILKSTDKGNTWTQLSATANKLEFQYVNRMIVDPKNADIVLAATIYGIFRSENGGSSWTRTLQSRSTIEHIVFQEDNFNIQYASDRGFGVFKSIDGGKNWVNRSVGITTHSRIELAIAPTNPQRIYASAGVTATTSELFVSYDGANSWQKAVKPNSTTSHNHLEAQVTYNNAIAVSPYDENVVITGGLNLWRLDMTEKTSKGNRQFMNTIEEGTAAFMDFTRVSGFELWDGKLRANTDVSQLASIEIRFGANKKQKAHRFFVPEKRTSGVPDAQYTYQNYVDVPFEVWDIDKNRQLMVSFRDQNRNGVFELAVTDDAAIEGREYLYVHNINYSPTTPSAEVSKDGGHINQQMYFVWPIPSRDLVNGQVVNIPWTPNALPESALRFVIGEPVSREVNGIDITDWNGSKSKKNLLETFHADQHSVLMLPTDRANKKLKIITTNDGGINVSEDNGENFSRFSDGYNTTQFYGVDKRKGEMQYIGGTQDRGTWLSTPNPSSTSNYNRVIGGDGFETVWHPTKPEQVIGSLYYNGLRRSTNGGASFSVAVSGLREGFSGGALEAVDSLAPFITRIGYSKSKPDVVFVVGRTGVWRSDDFGTSWVSIPINNRWRYGTTASNAFGQSAVNTLNVSVSLANPNVVWAGGGMTDVTSLQVSRDNGRTFATVNNLSGRAMGAISGIATHPFEENTAFVLFSLNGKPKILRTKNLGQTWEDITGFGTAGTTSNNGFPNVDVYSLLVFEHDPKMMWAGTEIGIFQTLDEGKTWALRNDFIAVSTWQMRLQDNQVVIATHGRGIWTAELPQSFKIITATDDTPATDESLKLYPNPYKNGELNIALPIRFNTVYQIEILNVAGQKVWKTQSFGGGKTRLDIPNLPKGTYVVHINDGKHLETTKLMID